MPDTYSILDGVTPEDLGLPSKFADFREIQREAVQFGLYGPGSGVDERRFIAMGAPTGCGKSLLATALGKMAGCKYAILTATRALEDQLVSDFSPSGLVNIRGRRNYHCVDPDRAGDPTWDCDRGDEDGCPRSDGPHCTYRSQVEEAKASRAIVTNYAYWMNVRSRNSMGLEEEGCVDPIGLLICDEAHKAADELSRFLGVWVSLADLHKWAGEPVRQCVEAAGGREWGVLTPAWIDALTMAWGAASRRSKEIEKWFASAAAAFRTSKEYRRLEKLIGDLERVVSLGADNNWLWRVTKSGIAFDCIWPGRYAERYLWTGVPKIVLMSATLRPKALSMVGLSEAKYWFREWPRVFPAANNPVVWIPTGKMGVKAGEDELAKAIARADEIYDEWAPGFKGIVHTASYRRAEWLQSKSRWGRHMLLNKSGEAVSMLERFKNAAPPAILVSPSYTTGFDIPPEAMAGDQWWQHVLKLPFADLGDPIVSARRESDADWLDYDTMQTLVQSCGRQNRASHHKCTVMITDDAVGRFRRYAARHAPAWFRVTESKTVPRAPRV